MKIFCKLALGLLFIVAASVNGATTVMAQSRMYGASSDSFYDDLAPYGRWVSVREYGNAWVPNVEPGFRPYATRGHWAMTEYGNTWVSDYDWGWAPFHYGRWAFDDYYGWIWIPGNEWAPAWVSWRSDNDYYGWAPLGPGIGIDIHVDIPLARWIFVPKGCFTSPQVYTYCLPPQRVVNVYRNTTVITNVYVNGRNRYAAGPYRDDIERYTRQRVNVYRIENDTRPSRMSERDGALRVYRPDVNGRRSENSGNGSYGNRNDNYGNRNDNSPGRDNQVWAQRDRGNQRSNDDRVIARPREGNNSNNSGAQGSYERGGDRTQSERYSRQEGARSERGNSEQPSTSGPSQAGRTTYPGNQQGQGSSERTYDRPARGNEASSGSGSATRGERPANSNPSSGESRGGRSSQSNSSGSGRSRPTRG